jgi:hemerythrin-like domain-containing protein
MANPTTIIKKDHRKAQGLFKDFADLTDGADKTRQALTKEIIDEITNHTDMEEVILYPFLQEKFSIEGKKMVEEAIAEHNVAKTLIKELESLSLEEAQFDVKMKALDEVINHHIKEEEEGLLPKTEKEIDKDELDILGDQMVAFKGE